MINELVRSLNVVSRSARFEDNLLAGLPEGLVPRHAVSIVDINAQKSFHTIHLTVVLAEQVPCSAQVMFNDKAYRGTITEKGILVLPPGSHCVLEGAAKTVSALEVSTTGADLGCGVEPALVANDATLKQLILLAHSMLILDLSAESRAQIVGRLSNLILNHLHSHYSNDSFLLPCSKRVEAQSNDDASSPVVARAVEYMLERIDQSITLDEVGQAVGKSPGQLGRLFKAQLGRSPYRYLIELRVERARTLLSSTTMPIAEVALDCGFANQEHLTRHFRQFSGTTPAAYRRQMSWKVHNGHQAHKASREEAA